VGGEQNQLFAEHYQGCMPKEGKILQKIKLVFLLLQRVSTFTFATNT